MIVAATADWRRYGSPVIRNTYQTAITRNDLNHQHRGNVEEPNTTQEAARPGWASPNLRSGISAENLLSYPRREIALAVQNTPHIDMVVALHVEDDVRIVWNQPESQLWQIQFMGVAWGTRGRMTTDIAVGLLQGIDETQRRIDRTLLQVVSNGLIDIPICLRAWDNRLYLQGFPPG
mgnify:FL=1